METGGGFVRDDFLLTAFEEPYPALKDVTEQGHINAMLDGNYKREVRDAPSLLPCS